MRNPLVSLFTAIGIAFAASGAVGFPLDYYVAPLRLTISPQGARVIDVRLNYHGTVNDGALLTPTRLDTLTIGASAFMYPNPFYTRSASVAVTDPAQDPIEGIVIPRRSSDNNLLALSNDTGRFARDANGTLAGTMPLRGAARLCLFASCDAEPIANVSVPLSVVGGGGTAFATAAIDLTVVGAPWTTETVAVGTMTAMGFADENGFPRQGFKLVTPIAISTSLESAPVIGWLGSLEMFVLIPEPATIALLGAGIAGLAAYGRSTQQKYSRSEADSIASREIG
jgi:hypothetical protein